MSDHNKKLPRKATFNRDRCYKTTSNTSGIGKGRTTTDLEVLLNEYPSRAEGVAALAALYRKHREMFLDPHTIYSKPGVLTRRGPSHSGLSTYMKRARKGDEPFATVFAAFEQVEDELAPTLYQEPMNNLKTQNPGQFIDRAHPDLSRSTKIRLDNRKIANVVSQVIQEHSTLAQSYLRQLLDNCLGDEETLSLDQDLIDYICATFENGLIEISEKFS
jgi:hypothetical protein